MIIRNANVWIDGAFQCVDVRFNEQEILEIGPGLQDDEILDAAGYDLYPGFVDTHMHGGFRHNFFHTPMTKPAATGAKTMSGSSLPNCRKPA